LSNFSKISRILAMTVGAFAFQCSSVGILAGSSIAGSATLPTCSSTVLSLKVGFSQAAAGNEGTPVVITNNGSTTCSLAGYPTAIAHTESVSPHPVTFVDRPRSMIYVVTPVRTIVLAPKRTASFGISYVDGRDQQYGQGKRCLMNYIAVQLPRVTPARKITVILRKGSDGFGGAINACFAGFAFGLTPIVKGSNPPGH
jgi:hypothetical protein